MVKRTSGCATGSYGIDVQEFRAIKHLGPGMSHNFQYGRIITYFEGNSWQNPFHPFHQDNRLTNEKSFSFP